MFKKLPLIAICSLVFAFFNSCTSDLGSLEAGPVAAYTFSSTAPVTAGLYVVGRQMNPTNTVTFQINVTVRGKYTVRTVTQGGIYFEASGVFTATGPQNLVLYGKGIPVSAGNYTYSAGSNGSNSFGITVLANMPPATFTYAGAPGACSAPSISGFYAASVAMGANNYVDLSVNVTNIGTYSVTTNSAGGINFFTSGTFSATGVQTIRLTAGGTPSAAGTYSYTPSGGCSFSITVAPPPPPAVFTYTCAAPSISGSFAVGTALTSASTITVPVNVTVAGIYSVTTDNQNGVTFSASGIFSGTGAQNIVLTSTNTPAATGTFTYTPSGAACTFDINYTSGGGGGGGGGTPTIFLKATVGGVVTNFNTGLLAIGDPASGNFSVGGSNSDGGSGDLHIAITDNSNPLASGDYNNFSLSNLNKGCQVTYNTTAYVTGINANSFVVHLTTITANSASGTFSGTLYDNAGAGPGTKTVTNGSFNVTF